MATIRQLIPQGAVKVTDKTSDSFAYIYTNGRGQPCAMAFHGTSAKPAWIYAFLSIAAREARIRSFFEARAQKAAMKAERKAERLKPHRLQLGHVLYSLWGYEQTNVNFYQVTRLIGRNTVELRELHQLIQDGQHWATGKAMPRLDDFQGEPFVRRVDGATQTVRISSYRSARVWDGRPLDWTAYH
ncbi:MAG: hypothetical protein ACRC67_44470 [Inquilinus sp.]|uniref:hypothetical protein n=1 Tax=Inquilinus sp. TaxID=1932117 RepID=UPI003F323906